MRLAHAKGYGSRRCWPCHKQTTQIVLAVMSLAVIPKHLEATIVLGPFIAPCSLAIPTLPLA